MSAYRISTLLKASAFLPQCARLSGAHKALPWGGGFQLFSAAFFLWGLLAPALAPPAGCGGSEWVEDPATDAPWLLTIPYYVEELHAIIQALGLSESGYYVYGSSWGSCLAQEWGVLRPKAKYML